MALGTSRVLVLLGVQQDVGILYVVGGSDSKESVYNVGDLGSIPGSGRSPGGGYGNPPQYSCLENPRDRGAWWAAVYGVAQSQTRLKRLSSSSSRDDRAEKAMAPHSSTLAWKIPWMEEPGRLQSMGSLSWA